MQSCGTNEKEEQKPSPTKPQESGMQQLEPNPSKTEFVQDELTTNEQDVTEEETQPNIKDTKQIHLVIYLLN